MTSISFLTLLHYKKDAQIAQLGLEFYQEIHGQDKLPPTNFVIPKEDDRYPVHLWGYNLGIGVQTHIAKHIHPSVKKCNK
jgi:hypothetical protein